MNRKGKSLGGKEPAVQEALSPKTRCLHEKSPVKIELLPLQFIIAIQVIMANRTELEMKFHLYLLVVFR